MAVLIHATCVLAIERDKDHIWEYWLVLGNRISLTDMPTLEEEGYALESTQLKRR